jgi:hypothetical protein
MKIYSKMGVCGSVLAALWATAGFARADTFELNYEAPGVQNTTATFSKVGVETFDNLPTGISSSPINANFVNPVTGQTVMTGTYSGPNGVQINAADQYGGAGGTGKYAVAFQNDPYTLTLNTQVNYFGYWLSALDSGNVVTFYNNGVQVGSVTPNQVSAVTKLNSAYYGNPNANYKGKDTSEPFAFINFYDTTGTFNQIKFSEVNFGGGYESDNQTVGLYTAVGTGSPLVEAPMPLLGASPFALVVIAAGCAYQLRFGARKETPRRSAKATSAAMSPDAVTI